MFSVCEKKMKTMMIEREVNRQKEVCFSVEPFPACTEHCRPWGIHMQSRAFHCIPANLEKTMKLVARVNKGEALWNITKQPVHFYHDVLVQPKCLPIV